MNFEQIIATFLQGVRYILVQAMNFKLVQAMNFKSHFVLLPYCHRQAMNQTLDSIHQEQPKYQSMNQALKSLIHDAVRQQMVQETVKKQIFTKLEFSHNFMSWMEDAYIIVRKIIKSQFFEIQKQAKEHGLINGGVILENLDDQFPSMQESQSSESQSSEQKQKPKKEVEDYDPPLRRTKSLPRWSNVEAPRLETTEIEPPEPADQLPRQNDRGPSGFSGRGSYQAIYQRQRRKFLEEDHDIKSLLLEIARKRRENQKKISIVRAPGKIRRNLGFAHRGEQK